MSAFPTFAIHARDLTRRFGTVQAVNQLSLDVPPGIIFGFLGPNGAGKTTTIQILLGLVAPSSGSAKVLGLDVGVHSDMIRTQTGALLEHSGIYERLSAEDNLEFYARIYRLPAMERKRRIEDLLRQMNLWDRRYDLAGRWSKGMKQRLALARVLLHKPRLIFLDEPTAGLDVVSAAQIRQNLQSIVEREETTIFLTTHNMTEVEEVCQKVGVIKNGVLVAQGSPQELRAKNKNQRIFVDGNGFSETVISQLKALPEILLVESAKNGLILEIPQKTDGAMLVNLLVENGVRINEVRHESDSLEKAFIALMEEEHV
jgi:ABC-2 type transport system ATP-binding protein